MTQWVKREILKIVLMTNNENFTDVNFIEFITPITRISVSSYVIFSTIILTIIPVITFLLGIAVYFFYKNKALGIFFVAANIILGLYIYYFWESLLDKKVLHEKQVNDNEKYIINILNNIDKVIYRGQSINESNNYEGKTDYCVKLAMDFYSSMNTHSFIINIYTHIVIFLCLGYLISLFFKKRVDSTTFVTFLTILLFYRDKVSSILNEIPDILEFTSRLVYIVDQFKQMLGNKEITDLKIYDPVSLKFDTIDFKNVSYAYSGTNKYVFQNINISLDFSDKILR
jgi:ABC-type multidrug transport system fused ATPase/permease subunit